MVPARRQRPGESPRQNLGEVLRRPRRPAGGISRWAARTGREAVDLLSAHERRFVGCPPPTAARVPWSAATPSIWRPCWPSSASSPRKNRTYNFVGRSSRVKSRASRRRRRYERPGVMCSPCGSSSIIVRRSSGSSVCVSNG